MDRLDVRLVDALQQDGGRTHGELAEMLGSTPSTCLRRINRLKERDVLGAPVFVASASKLGRGVTALILVTTASQDKSLRDDITRKVAEEPAINLAYGVTGEVDVVLLGNFASLEECQEVCDRLFDNDERIARYTTLFVVERFKEETAIPTDMLEALTANAV